MNVQDRILAAAETRVRRAGYNGFSFRDIAKDTGLTNAGVHHHFPTKADLVARLAETYRARFLTALDTCPPETRAARLRALFAESLREDGKMCLCGLLAAESADLPEPVTDEVRAFFDALADRLTPGFAGAPDPEAEALALLARLEGAAVLATVFSDPALFDRATEGIA